MTCTYFTRSDPLNKSQTSVTTTGPFNLLLSLRSLFEPSLEKSLNFQLRRFLTACISIKAPMEWGAREVTLLMPCSMCLISNIRDCNKRLSIQKTSILLYLELRESVELICLDPLKEKEISASIKHITLSSTGR